MLTAGQLCNRNIVTAMQTDLLLEVVQRIREADVGCAIVVDEPLGMPRRPIGVLSERDILARALAARRSARALRAGDIMTPVRPLLPQESAANVLRCMRAARVRYLPVVDEHGIMRGVVDFHDIRAFLLARAPDAWALITPERERDERGWRARDTVPPPRRREPERGG